MEKARTIREILLKSWKITWNNKKLWWLGFFVALGSVGQSFSYKGDTESGPVGNMEKLWNFALNHTGIVITVASLALLLFVGLLVLRIFSQAALIRSLSDLPVFATLPIRTLLGEGRKFFWRIMGIDFLFFAAIISALLALGMPVFFLISLESNILAAMVAGMALLIFLPLAILAYFVRTFAYLYAVIANFGMRKAIEGAYLLWRRKIGESIALALILGLIGFVAFLGAFATVLIAAIPLVVLGALAYAVFAQAGLFVIIGIGIALLLGLLFFVQAVLTVFSQSAWVLFFQSHAMHKVPEKELDKEESRMVAGHSPEPEAA
ncbi:MAG TPA: hypothetical protein PKA31_01715 [Candidatus Moranbacteria bacterium]|nr:hypothetical protein [Candidatus Moranbacteria bacterium]